MGRRFLFGDYEYDPGTGELRAGDSTSFLGPQPARVLALLLERSGVLVEREHIEAALWPAGNPGADEGINACIRQVRRALGDDAREPVYIETVPRRGYRFIAEVNERRGAALEAATSKRRLSWRTAAAMALPLVILTIWVTTVVSRAPADDVIGLAVLHFTDLDDDAWNERFANGLTEEVTTALGQVAPERVRVVSSAEAARFREVDKPLYVIGAELGVEYLVQGAVRRNNEEVLVTAQLVGVSDQAQRWSHRFGGLKAKPLEIQAEVARTLAGVIRGHFVSES